MKSYEVVETLRKSRKAVFTPKDIAKITGLNGSEVYVLISGKADYWESELKAAGDWYVTSF